MTTIVGPSPLLQENLKIKSDCLRLSCYVPFLVLCDMLAPVIVVCPLYGYLFNNYIIVIFPLTLDMFNASPI